ncbi:MAG: SAM hydrolase/SAM-dependent halogenase family protein [Chthonomonadales bacterium]
MGPRPQEAMGPIVTLTTDFGVEDAYAGIMKGVILSIAPKARIVDLCHGISPQNVVAGALALEAAVDCFPPGTIHVAVVDPGVGTERAAVAVQGTRHTYVGPDNGVLTLALEADPVVRAVSLTNPRFHRVTVSATFHGRDIFAPAAGSLAAGADLGEMGEPLASLTPIPLPSPRTTGGAVEAQVIHVDHFGNLITNLRAQELKRLKEEWGPADLVTHVGFARIPSISRTYADVAPGSLVAYVGSSNRLEIGVRNGSAARLLGVGVGSSVVVAHS